MTVSRRRVRAIFRKDLREYRRNGSIVCAMAVIPLIFVLPPLINIFALPESSASVLRHGEPLLYMLGIPAVVPAVVAAYAVVGERQQGTLEPLLTTPVRRDEFMLGKALAAFVPSLAISYAVYAAVLVSVEVFAHPAVASALRQVPQLVAQFFFTPLLAGWSIWVGMAISTRSTDVRVAQQLGMLASLPSVAITSLIAYNVIHPTLGVALGGAATLLILNGLGWRMTSATFDRERLIAGTG
jgi:ABC-type transport system involved in multi-copper enzyme maturation permease subunit